MVAFALLNPKHLGTHQHQQCLTNVKSSLRFNSCLCTCRQTLTDLGPSFIKAGQVLASRPDIVREDYMNELCTLQDDVPSFPDDQVGMLALTTGSKPHMMEAVHDAGPIQCTLYIMLGLYDAHLSWCKLNLITCLC